MADETTKPDPKRARMLQMGQDAQPAPIEEVAVEAAPEPVVELAVEPETVVEPEVEKTDVEEA